VNHGKVKRTVPVKDPGKFAAEDSFTIFDAQVGDNYRAPVIATK